MTSGNILLDGTSVGGNPKIIFRNTNTSNVGILDFNDTANAFTFNNRLDVKTTGADGIVLQQDLGDANNSGRIFFLGSVQTYEIFNNAGDLRITHSAIPGNTSGTSFARFTNTGKYFRMESGTGGIQFNGDTAAVNALNDYVQGTWSPSFAGAGTPNHTLQFGRYTKIGNIVYCTIAMRATSISGGSTIEITGLPFSGADVGDTAQRSTYSPRLGGHINNVTEATAKFRLNGAVMQGVKGDGSTTFMTATEFCGGGSVEITGNFLYYT
jgi:hypothetical protein